MGQRLIPVGELQRFLREHLEPPREPGELGTSGRPATLPRRVVERIRLGYRTLDFSESPAGVNFCAESLSLKGRHWLAPSSWFLGDADVVGQSGGRRRLVRG